MTDFSRRATLVLAIAVAGATLGNLSASAQVPAAPADSADQLVDAAVAAFQQGTRESRERAIGLFVEAAARYRAAGVRGEAGQQLASAAFLHNALGRPDSALAYYDAALRDLGDDVATRATVVRQIGEVYHGMGRLDSAVVRYAAALDLAREAGDRRGEGTTLNNIGSALNRLGRPDSAAWYLHRALVVRRQLDDAQGEAITLNNIALVHRSLGRADSAIVYLHESLRARRRAGDEGGEGTTLNNIGFAFELLELPDSALHYYREALPLLERVGAQRVIGVAIANLGRVHLTLGAHDSAFAQLRHAVELKRAEGDRAGEAWALTDLARTHQAGGLADSAQHYFDRALAALREVGDRAFEGNALFHIARFHHRAAPHRDVTRALAYYDSAAAIRAQVGARAGTDANRVAFIEQDVRLFSEWTLAWLARAAEAGDDAAAAASLAAAERGRAQALLELLRASAVDPVSVGDAAAAHVPGADLTAEGRRLAARVAALGATTLQYLVAEDSLVIWLIDRDGRIRAWTHGVQRDSLAALVGTWRNALGGGAAERGLLAVDAGDTRGLGIVRRGAASEAAARTLAETLLPPALRAQLPDAGEIVIVAHGPLTLVPFAALPWDTASTTLGSRHALRYAPSLATLLEVEAGERTAVRSSLGNALVIGNPVMPVVPLGGGESMPLAPLPGAQREAEWLAARLGVAPVTGGEATETAVLARIGDASIVHFATHGLAYSSDARTRDSFVALAPGDGRDGLFSVAKVLDEAPPLSADLVVLSACQTGLGNLRQAEGTVGLQRAFLARGARSVLVSLWSVSDEATEALMKAFYQHWLDADDTPTKAEALRRAQEDVRASEGFSDARYWAAFQLVGGS